MRNLMVLSASIALGGCLVDRGEADASEIPKPVQDAFENNCAVSGCHDAISAEANLSLAPGDLADIIDKSTPNSEFPLVSIGDLYGSYLALKILDDPSIVGEPMPLGGTSAEYEMSLILGWIAGLEIDDEISFPPAPIPDPPTFDAHVWPILDANCSCHKNAGSGAGMTLALTQEDAYANMVGVDYGMRKFIDPGDLSNSHVWQVVTGADGIPMPLGGPALDGRELQIIREWIEADAPE